MKDMMRKSVFAAFAAVLLPLAAVSQPKPGAPRAADYHFTTVKANPVTSVKNQYRSGTCWCFSSLSFLESEIMKAKGIPAATSATCWTSSPRTASSRNRSSPA